MVHHCARLHADPRNLPLTNHQGYDADNENIKLLRLRSFTIGKPIADEDLTGDDAQEKIISLIEIMEPFVSIAPLPPLLISPVFLSELAALAVLAVPFTKSALGDAYPLVFFVALTGAWAKGKQCLEIALHG